MKNLIKVFVLASVLVSTSGYSAGSIYEESTVTSDISGQISNGFIIKTMSGHVYKVTDYVYLYEYLYSPSVVVFEYGGLFMLVIDGIDDPLHASCLNCSKTEGNEKPASGLVESYIVSDFDGFDHGNIYGLANGQIWEQTEYWIWSWIWVSPSVTIWNDGGGYKMKVEQIEHAISVRQIK